MGSARERCDSSKSAPSRSASYGQASTQMPHRMQRLSSTSYFSRIRGFGMRAPVGQVAEADRLARALETASGFCDHLLAAVRDLVLDVALVADLGFHRLEPVARLLLLAREGHDREELRLRLVELLACLDHRQV